jgi:DNA-directed RNA polymerase subunit RPC12/RpoP
MSDSGDYYYNSRYETTYSRDSPYEQMKRDRGRINVAIPGMESWGIGYHEKRACMDCHQVYNVITDKITKKDMYFCKGCGDKIPIEKPKPKESKVKQKESREQNKTFITQNVGPARKKPGGRFGFPDFSSELSDQEMAWVSGMYGNVTDFSDG